MAPPFFAMRHILVGASGKGKLQVGDWTFGPMLLLSVILLLLTPALRFDALPTQNDSDRSLCRMLVGNHRNLTCRTEWQCTSSAVLHRFPICAGYYDELMTTMPRAEKAAQREWPAM